MALLLFGDNSSAISQFLFIFYIISNSILHMPHIIQFDLQTSFLKVSFYDIFNEFIVFNNLKSIFIERV